MSERTATARSFSNIALIKYWGNQDDALRIPANGSISMNLAGLETVTTVRFIEELSSDRLFLNGVAQGSEVMSRVTRHIDRARELAGQNLHAEVISQNNFPIGTGIASSASAFAALTAAACAALGLDPSERQLTTIARLGSGSASRSIPSGYVEWYAGNDHDSSYAESIAPPEHWALVDLIAIVSEHHKAVGSTQGHSLAPTSPLQTARVADSSRRLEECRAAIRSRDFDMLARIVEEDALLMHAVMMTSRPPLLYWLPTTLEIIRCVKEWRSQGIGAAFTIDAGPNVHILCEASHRDAVQARLREIEGVANILEAYPGDATHLLDDHLSPPNT